MAIQLQNTSQAIANNGVKMLVYGHAGVGKTTLAGTWKEEETIILANKNIDVIEIRNIEQLREAFLLLNSPHGQKWSLVVLDSISEIAEVCLAEELGKTPDGRKAYGELSKIIISLIRAFRDLSGKHVLLIAKIERAKDESTGAMLYRASAPGQKLPADLPYLVDVVMALRCERNAETHQVTRLLQSSPADGYEAKDRSRMLNQYEEPNLTNIISKIMQRS